MQGRYHPVWYRERMFACLFILYASHVNVTTLNSSGPCPEPYNYDIMQCNLKATGCSRIFPYAMLIF